MSLPIPTTAPNFPERHSHDVKRMNEMDAPLIALTNQCRGDLRQLMFAFFSFLNRRTDFYLVPQQEDVQQGVPASQMGFLQGDAEKLLLAAFRQFPLRRIPRGSNVTTSTATGSSTSTSTKTSFPSASSSQPKSERVLEKNPESKNPKSNNKDKINETKTDEVSASSSSPSNNMKGITYNEEGLQIPIGNGGSTPRYKWTQTLDEATVLIGVPKSFRGKDFDVKITPSKVFVQGKKSLPGSEGEEQQDKKHITFLDGMLAEKIRADESTWSVEDGVMMLTLDKSSKKLWRSVVVGDEEIDTEMVDSRTHISDYDDATQAQIRKIIFDQNQYHLDLPYSDEILAKEGTNLYHNNSTNPAAITDLPPGVEYIDKKTLDEAEKEQSNEN